MKVLIVGFGSMGKRRAKIIKELNPEAELLVIDSSENRRKEAENSFGFKTDKVLDNALKEFKPEMVFACSPPLTHHEIVLKSLEAGASTFSELNLSSLGYDKIIELEKESKKTAFLSSTMLYRNELEEIQAFVNQMKSSFFYQYHVGQYLPDWHPWERFSDFFVSEKETNGCREIFAVELPWLIRSFGEIQQIKIVSRRSSTLEIDYDDTFHCIFLHKSGTTGSVLVDVVSRIPSREFRLYSELCSITWDGTPDTLRIVDQSLSPKTIAYNDSIIKDDRYAKNIIENPYYREVEDFFNLVNGINCKKKYSYEEDKYVIDLIDRIENGD